MSTPHEYAAAGFRIIPCNTNKRPRVPKGFFGKAFPNATYTPDQFSADDLVAILTGPCPAFGPEGDWLTVIDLDGGTTTADVDHYTGVPLPKTLTSKRDRHLFFRVPPSEKRDQLKQWVRCFGRGADIPEVDFKWSGGYACQPQGAWEPHGWDPSRIAVLPEAWIDVLLERHASKPGRAVAAPAAPRKEEPMGDVPRIAMRALASVWPKSGDGCHDAALALGGILHDHSWWDEEDVAEFAGALFTETGTTNRITDVLYSFQNRRDGERSVYGIPTLKDICVQAGAGKRRFDEVLEVMRDQIPGMRPLKADVGGLRDARGPGTLAPNGKPTLQTGSDNEIAQRIVDQHLEGAKFDEDEIWMFEDGVWKALNDRQLHEWIMPFDGAVYDYTDKGRPKWLRLDSGDHARIRKTIEFTLAEPGFFARRPIGVAFRNGFLSVPSRAFGPLERDHKVRLALPFDYDPDVLTKNPPGEFIKFLRSVFMPDREAIDLLLQWLGYLLSERTDHHKILVMLGPPRAGKGVLLALIQTLFGTRAGAFKVAALEQNFGLECMLGKSVCFDCDVRRIARNESQIVERLLSISAHDPQAVPRKNRTDAQGALMARLMLASNPPFGLTDVGGALAGRFLILMFTRTWQGREDLTLGKKLERELPGIVALALDALETLDARGRFVEPASSLDARDTLQKLQSPMLSFLEDKCVLGPGLGVTCDDIWRAACDWRFAQHHTKMSGQSFRDFLETQGIKRRRPKAGDRKSLPRVYVGVTLAAAPKVVDEKGELQPPPKVVDEKGELKPAPIEPTLKVVGGTDHS